MPSFLIIFWKQVLNDVSIIVESEEVEIEAKEYLGQEALTIPMQSRKVWGFPRALRAVKYFSEHIYMFLSLYNMDMELFEKPRRIHCTLQPDNGFLYAIMGTREICYLWVR